MRNVVQSAASAPTTGVTGQEPLQSPVEAVVKKCSHPWQVSGGSPSSRRSQAMRSTALACSWVTPGKPSRNSSMLGPSSK